VWVTDKIPHVSNEGEPQPKIAELPVSCAQHTGKSFNANCGVLMESVDSEGVPIGGLNPPDINKPGGEPQTPKDWVLEFDFVHPV